MNWFVSQDEGLQKDDLYSQSIFQCEACDLNFSTPAELAHHLMTGFPLDHYTKDFLFSTLNVNALDFPPNVRVPPCRSGPTIAQPAPSICQICKRIFKNAKGLSQHIGKIHHKKSVQSLIN